MSANFTEQNELDAVLIYRDEQTKIDEYNAKFEELLELFVIPKDNFDGMIHKKIIDSGITQTTNVFTLPPTIQTDTHKNHWITDYPSTICPDKINLNEQLLICPFDIKGRNLIVDIIQGAEKFIYISTESFTDPDIVNDLIKKAISHVDVRIITGATSMDFSDRMQTMLRNLIASGIAVYTFEDNIHAKLLITDKHVCVSSINLNKMNLGFKRRSTLWRENTETISLCNDENIISTARYQFELILEKCTDISIKLAQKIEGSIKNLFSDYYDLRSKSEAKELFSRFILLQEINVKQVTLKIAKITSKLMSKFDRSLIDKDDFLMALILYYLSERKHDYDQLSEKLTILNTKFELSTLLSQLEAIGLIEKENDYYKLCITSLL